MEVAPVSKVESARISAASLFKIKGVYLHREEAINEYIERNGQK
jgi:hypothetical protein